MKKFILALALTGPTLACADSIPAHETKPVTFSEPESSRVWREADAEQRPVDISGWPGDEAKHDRGGHKRDAVIVAPEPNAVLLLVSAILVGTPFTFRRKRK